MRTKDRQAQEQTRMCSKCSAILPCIQWKFGFDPEKEFYLCEDCEDEVRAIFRRYEKAMMVDVEKWIYRLNIPRVKP